MLKNKTFLILFTGMLAVSLSAQQYRNYRSYRGRSGQQSTVQQKKSNESNKKKTDPSAVTTSSQSSSNKPTAKFDPKKPLLTQKQIDNRINEIRQKLLECKIQEKMPGLKDADEEDSPENKEKTESGKKANKYKFVSRLDLVILMSHYKSLLDKFELTEVSRIPLEWYQQFQAELQKFGPFINDMTIAIRSGNNNRYSTAAQKFKAQQEACLKFLKEKPPRISKEQYEALVLKNTKIRQQNYLKQRREEQAAALKRRQEQLKQLQQKSQPQKKDQKTANKK